MRLSPAAVVTQCCELLPRPAKLVPPAFSLARLIPIKESILKNETKLADLRANRDPRGDPPGFLQYFYIAPHALLENKEWRMDYSQIVSLPSTEFPSILTRKLLQMEDGTRVKFKIKLAAYVGRHTDEEIDAGLADPWA